MLVALSAWKLALAVALVGAIVASACARAPRHSTAVSDLRRLVLCALGLYALGAAASLTHHDAVALLVYGAGILVAAVAAWLSRGRDQEDPPDDEEPVEPPPPGPDGVPWFDWPAFEREFRRYAGSRRTPVGSRG